jgi:UDP-glucose 4-epimerase
MHHLVTGGAGFVGSHLVDRLVEEGHEVTVVDNLSSGRREFVEHHLDRDDLALVEKDLVEDDLDPHFQGVDVVHHLAANPDIRYGIENPDWDLQQNLVATQRVLEAMRAGDVGVVAFSSTSTVYGEVDVYPTPEDHGPLLPISLYGASKLGAEAYVSAYVGTYGAGEGHEAPIGSGFDALQAYVFRYANIIGPRGTHGVIVDFIDKLKEEPSTLEILGNGKQKKSYLHVEETVDAMLHVMEHARDPVNVYNLGCDDFVSVTRIAELVCEACGLDDVEFRYTGGDRGWAGDVPKMLLDVERLNELGWSADRTSEEAIRDTAEAIVEERWPERA